MSYDLLIRQSYHGSGVRRYQYKVYNHEKIKLGEIADIPAKCGIGDLVSINHQLYKIIDSYDSVKPREQKSEVVYYELQHFEPRPDYDLGEIF